MDNGWETDCENKITILGFLLITIIDYIILNIWPCVKYSFIYSILAANDELFIHAFPPPSLSLQEGISLLHYSVLQDRPEIVIYLSNSPDCLLTPQDKVLYSSS